MTKEQLRAIPGLMREHKQISTILARLESHPGPEPGEYTQEVRRVYREKLEALSAALLAVENALEALEPVERQLLRYRFIEGMSVTQVAAKMYYCRKQIFQIQARALKKLDKINPGG